MAGRNGDLAFHVVWSRLVVIGPNDWYLRMAVLLLQEVEGPLLHGRPVFGKIGKNHGYLWVQVMLNAFITRQSVATLNGNGFHNV